MTRLSDKTMLPAPGLALPGPAAAMPVPEAHFVNAHPLTPPFPAGMATALFALGCFWGAERRFWGLPGRPYHGRGLCRGRDAESDLRGGVQRADGARPRRSSWSSSRPACPMRRS